MKFIYNNDRGVFMELLQFLLTFLLKEYGGEKLTPLLNALNNGSFNLQSLLSFITPETLEPILKNLFGAKNEPCTQNFNVQGYGLKPIAQIADRDIVYTLNKYLSAQV